MGLLGNTLFSLLPPLLAAGNGWGRCRWLNAHKITFSVAPKTCMMVSLTCFCMSCWGTWYASAGQIVIKLTLKKPTWAVLLFKNFHGVLCECFNYGFISTLEPCSEVWLLCSGLCAEFPGLLACPSLLPWGGQGGTEASWENFTAWPWWAAAASEQPALSGTREHR